MATCWENETGRQAGRKEGRQTGRKEGAREGSGPDGWEGVGFIWSCMVPLCHSSAGLLAAPPWRLVCMCEQERPYVYFIKVKCACVAPCLRKVCVAGYYHHMQAVLRAEQLRGTQAPNNCIFQQLWLVFYGDCLSFILMYITVVSHTTRRQTCEVSCSQNENTLALFLN